MCFVFEVNTENYQSIFFYLIFKTGNIHKHFWMTRQEIYAYFCLILLIRNKLHAIYLP